MLYRIAHLMISCWAPNAFFLTCVSIALMSTTACSHRNQNDLGEMAWTDTEGKSLVDQEKITASVSSVLNNFSEEIESHPYIVNSIRKMQETSLSRASEDCERLKRLEAVAHTDSVEEQQLKSEITINSDMVLDENGLLSDALKGRTKVEMFDDILARSPCTKGVKLNACTALVAAAQRYQAIRSVAITNTDAAQLLLKQNSLRQKIIQTHIESYGGTRWRPAGR